MLKIINLLLILFILFNSSVNASEEINRRFSKRILMGNDAEIRQFPFMVSIRLRNSTKHVAGGVLLSYDYVLTAASGIEHFQVAQDIEIYLGMVNIKKEFDYSGWVTHASMTHVHPGYKSNKIAYNLALIELEKPVPRCRIFFGVIAPIFLDLLKQDDQFEALIIGWGARTERQEVQSTTLQYSRVGVTQTNNCVWNSSGEKFQRNCTRKFNEDNVYCVTDTSTGTCTTDIGGPLITLTGLVGIASKPSCGSEKPDIFVRIKDHQNWINSIVIFDF